MKKTKLTVFVILLMSLALVLTGCGGNQQAPASSSDTNQQEASSNTPVSEAKYTIKMHVNQPVADTSYHYVYARYLAEKVFEKTNGEVVLDIYPGSQLGTDPDVLEQMKVGSIQSGMFAFPNMINIYKPLNIFSLPYLFDDFNSASRAFNGPTAQKIYQDLEKSTGVKVLAVYNGGVRGLTTGEKAVKSVEDLKGLKIRTPGTPVLIRTMEELGANAVSMSGNEIFTSLQQGTVDGQDSSIAWAYDQGYHEIQKHLILTNHGFTGTCFIMSAQYFNSLPENIQNALLEAAKEAAAYTDGFCEMYDMAIVDKYISKGLDVTTLDVEKVRPLVQSVWEEFAEDVGGMETIQALIKDGERKTKY